MKIYNGLKEVRLGARLGIGADGAVYAAEDDQSSCIKIFDHGTRDRFRQSMGKLQKLVSLADSIGGNAALPTYIVTEAPNGNPVGFAMRRIEGKEVHNLYGVSSRQLHFPGADFRFLIQVAKNVAIATERLHAHKVVIGDISGRNLMVRKDATVCWIDADSFLIGSPTFKEICKLMTPEWTPPELQYDRHLKIPRLPAHDVFGLAVMIFHILMLGRHPFQGRFTGAGDAPDIPTNIASRWYAHAGYSGIPLKSPVGTPLVSHLGISIEHLFVRAFLEESADRRPSASEWVDAIRKLEVNIRRCQNFESHYFSSGASGCPWCRVLPEYGNVDPFLGVVIIPGTSGTVGVGNLVAEIVKFVNSLAPPVSVPNEIYRPTARAAAPTWTYVKPGWLASFFTSPESEKRKIQSVKSRFDAVFASIEAEKAKNLGLQQGWLNRIIQVVSRIKELQGEAVGVLNETKLREDARRFLEKPFLEKALVSHLAKYYITPGQIPGIGQRRISDLAGHGITTAADLVSKRILGIPGFGESLTDSLMMWRYMKEKSFRPGRIDIVPGHIEQQAQQSFFQSKAGFTKRHAALIREFDSLIQSAKECAGLADSIQQRIDVARANVIASDEAVRKFS